MSHDPSVGSPDATVLVLVTEVLLSLL